MYYAKFWGKKKRTKGKCEQKKLEVCLALPIMIKPSKVYNAFT